VKRILFVDHASRILGGAEINLIELLSAVSPSGGWPAACACREGSQLSRAVGALGARQWDYGFGSALDEFRLVHRRCSPLSVGRAFRALHSARRRLGEIMDEFRPNAVISCAAKDHFCAGPACRRAGASSIWWVNDILSADFFPWAARKAFVWRAKRHAARLVVVSEFARRALLEQGLPESLVTTIHNGLPLERYQRTSAEKFRGELGARLDEPLIGLVGRYVAWKGPAFFLRVAQAWVKTGAPGQFVLIGQAFNEDQAFEAELRRIIAENNLGGRVRLAPFQPDIAPALSALDVLMHTSLRPEPFGRVIIEAMALGVPVIAARAGGVPEIITDGVDGLLAEPGHLEEYRERLERLLGSESLAAALSRAGQATVRARFTLDRVRSQFETLLAEIG